MEKLELKYRVFKKAYKTLEHQLNKLLDPNKELFESIFRRKHGIKVASPKSVFQESMKQSIVDEEKTKILLSMVEDRNNTSHGYDEAIAKDIISRIPLYSKIMKFIIDKVTPLN